jgi:hypothetical protein
MESNAKGSPNGVSYVRGEPMDLSGYGYKDLHGLWKGAKNEYRKRLEEIADIESGSLRRANYQTQLHKLGREEIRHALANEYSNVARYSDPKVVSKFLEERLGDDPGFESWLAGWFLYVPSVLKKVHMEPAFMRAKQRMKTLPNEFQKNYVHHWIGALRGADTPYFAMLNRLAVENTAQPIATDALYKAVFGRDPADIAKQAREEGQLDHRMVQSASQNVNGWLYMTLIGLGRIVKLNATEFGYLARELSKRPLPDLALGVPWAIKGFAKTTLDGLKESAGFVANQVNPELPRWYSEPTRMQVNDFLHDMADEVAQQGPEQVGGMGTRARRAVNHLWSPLLRASEFMIRGTNNYTWLSRVKRYISPEFLIEHGYDPDDFYKTIAANDTNRNVGSFGPRDVSPHTRGIVGKAYLPLRRFTWTHTGHLGAAIGGSMEAGHRGAAAIAGKVGLGNRIPGPGEPSDMDPPDPPPPPDVPGAEFNDWSDRERAAWTAYHTPSPAYGEGVPRGSAASMRWLYTAALGWPIAGWALYSIAQSVFTDEDHMSDSRAVDMLNPVDLRRSAEIPVLHGVEALYDAAYLPGKMWAFGRTPRDRDKLADARRDLVFKIPIYGRHTSETYWKVKRREAWDRRIMEADVQDIAKRHNIKLPKMPPPQTWWWETDPMVDKIIEDALTTGYEKDPSSLILQPGVISRVKKRFKEAIGIESEADKRVKAALERLEALKAAEAQPPQEQQP